MSAASVRPCVFSKPKWRVVVTGARALRRGRGGLQGSLLGFGRILVRAAEERDKPNEKRLRGYTESSLPGLEQS